MFRIIRRRSTIKSLSCGSSRPAIGYKTPIVLSKSAISSQAYRLPATPDTFLSRHYDRAVLTSFQGVRF